MERKGSTWPVANKNSWTWNKFLVSVEDRLDEGDRGIKIVGGA